jgi:hypothetical protein
MNALLKIIDEKNNQLLEFDAKKTKRDNLAIELALLDKEISEFNKEQICNDIDELTDYAVKLGFIEVETVVSENDENSQLNTCEEV